MGLSEAHKRNRKFFLLDPCGRKTYFFKHDLQVWVAGITTEAPVTESSLTELDVGHQTEAEIWTTKSSVDLFPRGPK